MREAVRVLVMAGFVLAMDQGTTSCRAVVFDKCGRVVAMSQREISQFYPKPGWVEHDAEEIFRVQVAVAEEVIEVVGVDALVAIGVTNQRETVVVWDRVSGEPLAKAIVWQDRRGAGVCEEMRAAGLETAISAMTGLRLDSYFSATKVQWLLENVAGLRERAEAGEVCMGTMDCWLVYKLTGGKVHVTDATNASRTMLYNIHSGEWDDGLLKEFGVPREMLPEVVDSAGVVGEWRGVPIAGMVGDQQAALFGQGCHRPGMVKNTYGTGCFMLEHTGERVVRSRQRLLSTVAVQLEGKREYCLEGSVFIAGALFQWLREGLGLFETMEEFEQLAGSVVDAGGVVIVPALVGMGAPHWDADARGVISGLSRGTTKAHICRAAIDAVSFQALELLECMEADSSSKVVELRVDGGAAACDLLLQVQADVLGCEVVRAALVESTAFGAAALAGLAVGFWGGREELEKLWREEKRFTPRLDVESRQAMRVEWDRVVQRAKS